MEPVFNKSKSGKLSLADTLEAITIKREHRERAYSKALEAGVVRSRAEDAVRRLNGDVTNKVHLLGQFIVQFGQFRHETFQWLTSNALGYAAYIVASSENDPKSADARWVNKMALKNYLSLFPEGLEAIELKKAEKGRTSAKVQTKPAPAAAVDVLSDTDDLEMSAMVDKIEHELAASQKSLPTTPVTATSTPATQVKSVSEVTPASQKSLPTTPVTATSTPATQVKSVSEVTPVVVASPGSVEYSASDEHSSSEKKSRPLQKKVRSVSGAPMKSVRSLFLGQSTSSTGEQSRPTVTSATDVVSSATTATTSTTSPLMSLVSVQRVQPSSASEGANIDIQSSSGRSPLLESVINGNFNVARVLIEAGSNLNLVDTKGTSVLHQLCFSRDPDIEMIKLVLEIPLLKKWRNTLPSVDHSWVSTTLFLTDHLGESRVDFSKITGLWLYPPQAPLVPQSAPKLQNFFGHRVFLWMPVKLWSLRVSCPHPNCNNPELSFAGVYQVVRQVLDVSSFYNLVSETLWCKRCKRKMVSWSHNILSQIDVGHRSSFPCILTTMKACDMKVAILMRQRGLGNSASQVQKKLQEEHSTEWFNRTIQYLSACQTIKSAASSGLIQQQTFPEPPAMTPVPQYRWLMQVYIQDVLQRLDEVKANITSVFGRILKIDSTKKVTKKLSGPATGTAEWATNVGNEYGQVLMTVLTAGEGRFGLNRMAKGLMKRYRDAKEPVPKVMYVDRDCCGHANILNLFDSWKEDVQVKLDVWHFMRRIASACHTDSHPLYGLFMQKLSQCIFAWDPEDLNALKAAKRAELLAKHVPSPSDALVMRSVSKSELALHCRRTTRGVDETTKLIGDLISAFDGEKGRDTLGVPLINSWRMKEEWSAQQRHVPCLQDPEGVQLYLQTGTLKKGGKVLPVYRCSRGSTSLESFHNHLHRFIPGTLANDTVFQAYLVDGLSRWNQDRASAATEMKEPHSYSGLLRFTANQLTENLFGQRLSSYTPPRKYTGELIGIEYLYDQTGRPLQEYNMAIQQMEETGLDVPEEDEGFAEVEVEDRTIPDLDIEERVCVQSETPPATIIQQLKPSAPVTERPSIARQECIKPQTIKRARSEPMPVRQEEPSQPITAPVIQKPSEATQGEQLQSTPAILPYPEEDTNPTEEDDSIGPDDIPGYGQVQALASFLAELRFSDLFLTSTKAKQLTSLWNALNDYDKRAIVFSQVFTKQSRGRFRAKRHSAPGVESTERSMHGPDSVPAARPDCNRYVEALVHRLSVAFPGPRRREGDVWSRWSLILEAYTKIKTTVINCASVMNDTRIQLPDISQKTLKAWHNDRARDVSRQVLYQGLQLPGMSYTATKVLPDPLTAATLASGITSTSEKHQFSLPEDTSGSVTHIPKKRKIKTATVVCPPIQQATQREHLLPGTQPAVTVIPVPAPPTPVVLPVASVPYTTQRYRKKKEQEETSGVHRRTYKKKKDVKQCKKCGNVIEKPGHTNYFGNLFCSFSETRSFEEWKIQFSDKNYGKKK